MSERKVLNKYYPPDFDPSKIGRLKRAAPRPMIVRLMAPFSLRCNACGEYIYKGKKFNARKERTKETYFGIKIIRFYIKCTRCSAEMTFCTDPKNTDYKAEHGMSRNFEPWRDSGGAVVPDETDEERLLRLEAEEQEDPMEQLEKGTVDAKREMDILDQLQMLRQRNARLERVDRGTATEKIAERAGIQGIDPEETLPEVRAILDLEAEEDEAEVRRVFSRINAGEMPNIELDEPVESDDVDTDETRTPPVAGPSRIPAAVTLKRKVDDDDVAPDALSLLSDSARAMLASSAMPAPAVPSRSAPSPALPAPKRPKPGPSKLGIKLGVKPKSKP